MKLLGALASLITIITGIYFIMDRLDTGGKHYGALSYVSNGVYGSVWQQDSSSEAKNISLKDCQLQSKGKPCKTRLIQDKECISLAKSTKRNLQIVAISVDHSTAAAENSALKSCNKKIKKREKKGSCTIATSICADGRHS